MAFEAGRKNEGTRSLVTFNIERGQWAGNDLRYRETYGSTQHIGPNEEANGMVT